MAAERAVPHLAQGMTLDESEGRELVRIARVCGKAFLRDGRMPPGKPHRPLLLANTAAQVTITFGGESRTKSRLVADRPLYRVVGELTAAAAGEEPALQPDDVTNAGVHIVLLSTPRRLKREPAIGIVANVDSGEIALGEIDPTSHAVVVEYGETIRLALPRAESAEELLSKACCAAGLPNDAWRHESPALVVHIFDAQSIAE